MKYSPILLFIILYVASSRFGFCQTPFLSESLIKYDLTTHKTDKPIPFDRSFTLVVEKLSAKKIGYVHAYQAEFSNGRRKLKEDSIINCFGKTIEAAVKDIVLNVNTNSDTLKIFFPPLKPNVDFDVNVVYTLSNECRDLLHKVNILLERGKIPEANDQYNKFINCTIDKTINRSNMSLTDFGEYRYFFNSYLLRFYGDIVTNANYSTPAFLTEEDIQGITIATGREISDYKDVPYLLELVKTAHQDDFLLGNLNIKKIYADDPITTISNGDTRLVNFISNRMFFDSLLFRLNKVIAKDRMSILVNGSYKSIELIRSKVDHIRQALSSNYEYLSACMKNINRIIDQDSRLQQGVYLAGNTVSSDLKSAGGSILFLDAGFTNILVPGLKNQLTYIPKLYWGISIYFRPIDKNTRQNRFPQQSTLPYYPGCNPQDGTFGPDYGIVSSKSILQHLSLNIGITLGSITAPEFENFYNTNSLLVGPAYRFARAFKVSAGLSLLKRSSLNPLISEKQVVVGSYASLSVDIDFIQSIKDVTSLFFK